MNLILLGAPGAGKGTIAQKLVERMKIPQISTGDLLREAVAKKTKIGKEAETYMKGGKLVPDEIVLGLLEERLKKKDCKSGFILDGFPRSIDQAKKLDKFTHVDTVLNIDVDLSILVDRLTGRRTCRKCNAVYHVKNVPPKKEGICDSCGGELYQRSDDNVETVKKRFDTYRQNTEPLIDFYKSEGKMVRVDGGRTPEATLKDAIKLLG